MSMSREVAAMIPNVLVEASGTMTVIRETEIVTVTVTVIEKGTEIVTVIVIEKEKGNGIVTETGIVTGIIVTIVIETENVTVTVTVTAIVNEIVIVTRRRKRKKKRRRLQKTSIDRVSWAFNSLQRSCWNSLLTWSVSASVANSTKSRNRMPSMRLPNGQLHHSPPTCVLGFLVPGFFLYVNDYLQ
jgi:hypothetical protein